MEAPSVTLGLEDCRQIALRSVLRGFSGIFTCITWNEGYEKLFFEFIEALTCISEL